MTAKTLEKSAQT